jgi:hypothetical protein
MYNWSEFINKTKALKPRKLSLQACKYIKEYNYALDFGAGGLRDTRYLLQFPFKGIDVLDSSPETKKIAEGLDKSNINVFSEKYEDFNYIPHRYDIINAQFALPFIRKNKQKEVLNNLITSLNINGIFTGNFFGIEDSWNDDKHKGISFYTKGQVEEILKGLKTVYIRERKYNKESVVDGIPEMWHVIEFIAIKST